MRRPAKCHATWANAALVSPEMTAVDPALCVAFLGPPGTFSEEALLSQPDLAAAQLQPMQLQTIPLTAGPGGGG